MLSEQVIVETAYSGKLRVEIKVFVGVKGLKLKD